MNANTKHTPTPWRLAEPDEFPWILCPADYRGEPTFTVICDHPSYRGYGVISVPMSITDHNPSNAAFIVRAVNAHDELVAALRLYIDAGIHQSTDFGVQTRAYLLARAALAKAEGGQS